MPVPAAAADACDGGAAAYVPIDCADHDRLEALATGRRAVVLTYAAPAGESVTRSAVVQDVFARGGVEFVALRGGPTLRLDALREVDGHAFAATACALPVVTAE